jgi:hypothetical protein
MKRKLVLFSTLALTVVYLLTVNGCKKEEVKFLLSTLMAGNVDLNAATAPTDVSPTTTITATFSSDVDASTADASTITLTRDYDGMAMTLNVATSGNTVTITPDGDLGTGALYELKFLAGIKGTNGKDLTPFSRAFTTMGTFAPAGAMAYWNFDGNTDDQVGSFSSDAAIDITYSDSYSANAGKAATFNGTTSLIEIPNGDQLMNTSDFSLCFWVKQDTTGKGDQFVLGLAGWYGFQFEMNNGINTDAKVYGWCKLAAQYNESDTASASEDLYFPGDGQTGSNGGWQGWTFCKDLRDAGGLLALSANKWMQVVCVYNSATKVGTMYINGERMKAQDFNLWPDTDPKRGVVGLKYAGNPDGNHLAFGFIQGRDNPTIPDDWAQYSNPDNNHFKGMLDDVRIYHRVLNENEIQLMYNSAK